MSIKKIIGVAVALLCLGTAALAISLYMLQPPWLPGWLRSPESNQMTTDDIVDFIINKVSADNIRSKLRYLTSKPHVGGTEAERETAEWVKKTWEEQGMDQVHLLPYDVLLSYPDKDIPNAVRLIDENGEITWTSQGWQKPLYSPEESSPDILPNFNGYSPPGHVKGEVIYAHFGRQEDFDLLRTLGVEVQDKIVLARYGAIFRGNIVQTAEQLGAIGVVIYPDPEQYAPAGEDSVYADTVYMPGSAAPAGTVYVGDGDPLTPFYPSVEHAFRIPESDADIPKIPVQAICYDDAREILGQMNGTTVPAEWQGALNVTYRLGPGLANPGWTVELEVHTHPAHTTTYNVIGVILGSEEPDRYVVLGNHRDAWIFGAVDPSSGTAAMLELSRLLLAYKNETGWRPRRSIIICSWGSEEYGLIGSTEWTEHFGKQLSDRAVAYLNMDMAIEGNYTLRTESVPLLSEAVFRAAAKVPNPDKEEFALGHLTVYDTWVSRLPDPEKPGKPILTGVGSGTDYKGFQHNLGIPSLDIRYTYNHDMFGYQLYHTLYETFALVDELYDADFKFHSAMTSVWAVLAVDFAESQLLPLSLVEYSDFISSAYDDVVLNIGPLVTKRNLTLEYFGDAVLAFKFAAEEFTNNLPLVDTSKPLAVRKANDQMMMVERSFIDPRGLPGRPTFNHVVVAPSVNNAYASSAFSGLTDVLNGIEDLDPDEQEMRWSIFSQHLGAVTHYVNAAAKVLNEDLW